MCLNTSFNFFQSHHFFVCQRTEDAYCTFFLLDTPLNIVFLDTPLNNLVTPRCILLVFFLATWAPHIVTF